MFTGQFYVSHHNWLADLQQYIAIAEVMLSLFQALSRC
jgi:hypothetical protein